MYLNLKIYVLFLSRRWSVGTIYVQGSYGAWKSWKSMEFRFSIFQALKSWNSNLIALKLVEVAWKIWIRLFFVTKMVQCVILMVVRSFETTRIFYGQPNVAKICARGCPSDYQIPNLEVNGLSMWLTWLAYFTLLKCGIIQFLHEDWN